MKLPILLIAFLILSCADIQKQEITGLWELHEATLDIMPRKTQPTYIKINPDNSFAVARRSGDLSGIYSLCPGRIEFSSDDQTWFNRTWEVSYLEGNLILKSTDPRKGRTRLNFRKTDRVPDFQEFENMVVGKWQIYSTLINDNWQPMPNTWFDIRSDGTYTLSDSSGIVESGQAIINTRHKKIIFETDSTIWNAWFYGKELRLDNAQLNLHFSLKRED